MKKTLLFLLVLVLFLTIVHGQEVNYDHRIWAINCGYAESDTFSGFIPDTFAVKGEALWDWGENAISVEGVENAAPAEVYETTRFEWNGADVEYLITGLQPDETFLVRLHWGELTETVAGRVFDVNINDIPYEIGFDIYAINGVAAKAVVRDYEVASSDTGSIDILFTNVQADNALINGIEIFGATAVGLAPTAKAAPEINIFPNPASEQIQIRSSGDEVTTLNIYNSLGKLVYSLPEGFTGNKTIYLETFQKGLYFIRMNINNNIQVVSKTMVVR